VITAAAYSICATKACGRVIILRAKPLLLVHRRINKHTHGSSPSFIHSVGQNRIFALYMTV